MDRFGKIALATSVGVIAAAAVVVIAAPTPAASPAPRATTITETASPAFETPSRFPSQWVNGDYIIGEDIPLGTYTSAGAVDDISPLCMATSNGAGHWPILKAANADERIIIRLTSANKGDVLTISGCKPLTLKDRG